MIKWKSGGRWCSWEAVYANTQHHVPEEPHLQDLIPPRTPVGFALSFLTGETAAEIYCSSF